MTPLCVSKLIKLTLLGESALNVFAVYDICRQSIDDPAIQPYNLKEPPAGPKMDKLSNLFQLYGTTLGNKVTANSRLALDL